MNICVWCPEGGVRSLELELKMVAVCDHVDTRN